MRDTTPFLRASTFRFAAAAVVSAGALALSAQTGHAGSGGAKFLMTSFVQNGRTDVRRNEMLEFKFTMPVRKGSVDDRTIRVAENTGTGTKPAIGARVTRGNVVRVDPTRTQKNYDDSKKPNSTITEKDHATGYSAYQDFTIDIPALPELHTLRNNHGDRLAQIFTGNFRTNAVYNDPVPGQPYFVGDHGTGLLGFDPPRSGATGLVDEDAVIVLEFSEPILIDTLDPSATIIVLRYTVGEQVPGFIKQDPNEPSGRRFLFVPSVGFGTDVAQQQGWDIQVTLTSGITDLAGNKLKRPVTFPVFRTRFAPGTPSASLVTETFADQLKMDPATVTRGGEWNTTEKGFLRGGAPTTYPNVNVQYTAASTGTTVVRGQVGEPLVAEQVPASGGGGCISRPQGSRVQMMYTKDDVGIDAAIVGVGWGPSSNALFAATYPEIILGMGHSSLTSLGPDFDANINVGSSQQLYTGQYDVPQAKNINPPGLDNGYWPWPTFSTVFEWNGVNNLIFDAAVAGGNNCQLLREGFIPAGISFPTRRAVSINYHSSVAESATDTVVYDIRFQKRRRTTQAISTWYQLASDNPIFATPILNPVAQAGGVSALLEVEGAYGKPDPFNVGGFIADPTTGTGFSPNASDINGHLFFRFRISMYANLGTNQTVRLSSVQFPYQF
jgi:hypothetical protein